MKSETWKIHREVKEQTDGQRRWDLAYQCLLKWGKELNQSPNQQEVSHEDSHLRTSINSTAGPNPDDRTTD